MPLLDLVAAIVCVPLAVSVRLAVWLQLGLTLGVGLLDGLIASRPSVHSTPHASASDSHRWY